MVGPAGCGKAPSAFKMRAAPATQLPLYKVVGRDYSSAFSQHVSSYRQNDSATWWVFNLLSTTWSLSLYYRDLVRTMFLDPLLCDKGRPWLLHLTSRNHTYSSVIGLADMYHMMDCIHIAVLQLASITWSSTPRRSEDMCASDPKVGSSTSVQLFFRRRINYKLKCKRTMADSSAVMFIIIKASCWIATTILIFYWNNFSLQLYEL